MINSISQLTPHQATGPNAPVAVGEHSPDVAIAKNEVREQLVPVVQGSKETAPVEVLADAVDQLNEHAQGTQRNLSFSVDDSSGRTVVRVVDTQTEEVIRQIPSEEMLVLIRNFSESIGNIFDEVV